VEEETSNTKWIAVIGRALAFLCVQSEFMPNKTLLERADLLRKLGLSQAEAATLLDTTPHSLHSLRHQSKKRVKVKRATKKSKN